MEYATYNGRRATFPMQLYALLEQAPPHIIGWLDDGDAFRIHDKQAFVEARSVPFRRPRRTRTTHAHNTN